MKQSELITDRPDTVTVNGDGLLHWWKRDQAGEVFIYKMVIVENGIYGLSLQWLDGRRLYRFGETAIAAMQPAISFKPLSQRHRQQATYKAMELFK